MLERFFTDTLSNAVVLDDVRVLSTSAARLFEDGGPLRVLLHEKTHHASFDGSVGLALAALNASGAFDAASVDPKIFTLSQRDYLLGEYTYQFLEPLIEGLALFAEFDAMPGSGKVASGVSQAAAWLLFGPTGVTAFDELARLEAYHRMLPDHESAKRDLLTAPLNQRPRYLFGYLAVKTLYWRLKTRCPRLADSDLFVLLMLDYWFRDRHLAARLLATDRRSATMVGEDFAWIVNHFEDRYDELVTNVDSYLVQLVEWLLSSRPDPVPVGGVNGPAYRGPAIPNMPMAVVLRTASLQAALGADPFRYRPDFRFASTEVRIDISSKRRARLVTSAGELAGENIPVVENAGVGTFDGAIEGVLTPALGGRIVMIVSADDGVVAVRDWGAESWNPPDLVEYFDGFPSALEIQRLRSRVVNAHTATAALPLVKKVRAVFEVNCGAAIDHVYAQLCTAGLPKAARASLISGLTAKGFAGPLASQRLLDSLSRTSARAGVMEWAFRADADANKWIAAPLEQDIADINRLVRPVLGRDPLVAIDGRVASLV
jgi:hypothetical protein